MHRDKSQSQTSNIKREREREGERKRKKMRNPHPGEIVARSIDELTDTKLDRCDSSWRDASERGPDRTTSSRPTASVSYEPMNSANSLDCRHRPPLYESRSPSGTRNEEQGTRYARGKEIRALMSGVGVDVTCQ